MSLDSEIRGIIEPGDTLIYWTPCLLDIAISLKTWCWDAAHVEIYRGSSMSVAARASGVNIYPLRTEGLQYIRRPIMPFDDKAAMAWFMEPFDPKTQKGVRGQKYDVLGLLIFLSAVKRGSKDRMFCSEFWSRYYRSGGLHVMAEDWDADRVAPAQCRQTPALKTIWSMGHGSMSCALQQGPPRIDPLRTFQRSLSFLRHENVITSPELPSSR